MKLWRSMTSALDLPLLQGDRTKKQAATFKFSRFAPVAALRVFLKTRVIGLPERLWETPVLVLLMSCVSYSVLAIF